MPRHGAGVDEHGGADARQREVCVLVLEFAFANALIALALVPMATLTGGIEAAVRVDAAVVIVYLLWSARSCSGGCVTPRSR